MIILPLKTIEEADDAYKEASKSDLKEYITAQLQNGFYVASWTPSSYSTFTVEATATDNDGKVGSKSIQLTIGLPPTI